MTKYREILRLKSLGFSERNIAQSCGVSRNTVAKVLKKAAEINLSWPLDFDMTDSALEELIQETDDHTCIAQHLILRILQDMCRTEEYCQCPDQEDQVLLRQHPAACHSHDADHRYQKLDQCDQFSYQVLSFHFQKSLSHIIHPSSVTVQ